jgi:hypothetical protein
MKEYAKIRKTTFAQFHSNNLGSRNHEYTVFRIFRETLLIIVPRNPS